MHFGLWSVWEYAPFCRLNGQQDVWDVFRKLEAGGCGRVPQLAGEVRLEWVGDGAGVVVIMKLLS